MLRKREINQEIASVSVRKNRLGTFHMAPYLGSGRPESVKDGIFHIRLNTINMLCRKLFQSLTRKKNGFCSHLPKWREKRTTFWLLGKPGSPHRWRQWFLVLNT